MNNQENILMMDGNGIMKDSNGNVIAKFATLKSELLLSTPSIADLAKRIESLEKQLADMQKATSCDFKIKNNEIFIKEEVIKSENFYINSDGNSGFSLTHNMNIKNNREPEGGDDVIFVDKLTAPPIKLRSY